MTESQKTEFDRFQERVKARDEAMERKRELQKFWDTQDESKPVRKVVQLAVDDEACVYALCNDGSMWRKLGMDWSRIADIPQPE